MNQPVSSLMSKDVVSVAADDTIATVGDELLRNGMSFVPVLARTGGTLLGVITTECLLQFRQSGRDPDKVHAWEVCAYQPYEVGPDTPLAEVARLMADHHVHHVIVTQNKTLLGVVSALDIVRRCVAGGA